VKKDQNSNLKLLLDEDLSPRNANVLCKEDLIDTVAIRDRGYCGALDHEVLELAYQDDRMLVTANVKDFEKFASLRELHCGLILIMDGDLSREEQLHAIRQAISLISNSEPMDMTNRALYLDWRKKTWYFKSIP
jgi:predicted nuclease of predicted toxin-antitoxin system